MAESLGDHPEPPDLGPHMLAIFVLRIHPWRCMAAAAVHRLEARMSSRCLPFKACLPANPLALPGGPRPPRPQLAPGAPARLPQHTQRRAMASSQRAGPAADVDLVQGFQRWIHRCNSAATKLPSLVPFELPECAQPIGYLLPEYGVGVGVWVWGGDWGVKEKAAPRGKRGMVEREGPEMRGWRGLRACTQTGVGSVWAGSVTRSIHPPFVLCRTGGRRFAEELKPHGEVFRWERGGPLTLSPELRTPEQRTAGVDRVLRSLQDRGLVSGWRGELYPVAPTFHGPPAFLLERAAAVHFGIKAYGARGWRVL